jgi:hypothetical protein
VFISFVNNLEGTKIVGVNNLEGTKIVGVIGFSTGFGER